MTKELSRLIEIINSKKNMNEMISAKEFIKMLRKGIIEEPEKLEELIESYDDLIKKSSLITNSALRRNAVLRELAKYAFLADCVFLNVALKNNFYELNPLREYFEDIKLYGPVTKTLSQYLGYEGKALAIKIFNPAILN